MELWKSDGTPDGTVGVKDINPTGNAIVRLNGWLTDVGGVLHFAANDGVSGTELWRSDGRDDPGQSGGGVLDLMVRGTDNGIYHDHFDGTAWSGWLRLPGATLSRPALVAE